MPKESAETKLELKVRPAREIESLMCVFAASVQSKDLTADERARCLAMFEVLHWACYSQEYERLDTMASKARHLLDKVHSAVVN